MLLDLGGALFVDNDPACEVVLWEKFVRMESFKQMCWKLKCLLYSESEWVAGQPLLGTGMGNPTTDVNAKQQKMRLIHNGQMKNQLVVMLDDGVVSPFKIGNSVTKMRSLDGDSEILSGDAHAERMKHQVSISIRRMFFFS
jgi:hypothetical protein